MYKHIVHKINKTGNDEIDGHQEWMRKITYGILIQRSIYASEKNKSLQLHSSMWVNLTMKSFAKITCSMAPFKYGGKQCKE